MIFCTQLRRKTDPSVLHPVVVSIDYLKTRFKQQSGTLTDWFEMNIMVQTDTNQDGTPDVVDCPLSHVDIEKKITLTSEDNPTLISVVDARLRNGGNLMAGIRTFCKSKIRAHNEAVSPGDTEETYTDIDTDTV